MNIQNIILLIAAGINLLMSILVFSRGVKNNKINLYFSLLALFDFFWCMNIFFARTAVGPWWYLNAQLAYLSALAIAMALFLFSVYYHYKISYYKYTSLIFIVIFLMFSFFIFGNFFIIGSEKNILLTEYALFVRKELYILYAITFVGIVLLAIRNFIIKYLKSEGVIRDSIKLLIITISIGLIFGIYFDLFLCYFSNWKLVWFGPIFTVFMNYLVFYLIFLKKENNRTT